MQAVTPCPHDFVLFLIVTDFLGTHFNSHYVCVGPVSAMSVGSEHIGDTHQLSHSRIPEAVLLSITGKTVLRMAKV